MIDKLLNFNSVNTLFSTVCKSVNFKPVKDSCSLTALTKPLPAEILLHIFNSGEYNPKLRLLSKNIKNGIDLYNSITRPEIHFQNAFSKILLSFKKDHLNSNYDDDEKMQLKLVLKLELVKVFQKYSQFTDKPIKILDNFKSMHAFSNIFDSKNTLYKEEIATIIMVARYYIENPTSPNKIDWLIT